MFLLEGGRIEIFTGARPHRPVAPRVAQRSAYSGWSPTLVSAKTVLIVSMYVRPPNERVSRRQISAGSTFAGLSGSVSKATSQAIGRRSIIRRLLACRLDATTLPRP